MSQYVFAGSLINDVTGQGPKRNFKVESVNGLKGHVARVGKTTKVRIVQGDEDNDADFSLTPRKLELSPLPCMSNQLVKVKRFFDRYGVEVGRSSACCMSIEGSEGTGKTMLLNHIADSKWGKIIRVGSSDKAATIENYFNTAIMSERQTLILIDNFANLKETGKKPVLEALEAGFERLAAETQQRRRRPNVAVIMTCRDFHEEVPQTLRVSRYFQTRVTLPIPDTAGRKEIIRYHAPKFPQDCTEHYISELGERTHAYTGADLWELIIHAERAMEDRTDTIDGEVIWEDVKYALAEVPPTAMHDVMLKPPTVHWSDIGGYNDVKESLQTYIQRSQVSFTYPISLYTRILLTPFAARPSPFTQATKGCHALWSSRLLQDHDCTGNGYRIRVQLLRS